MRYDHDYEYAYYNYRPENGKKNVARYTITGCRINGDYFRFYADNRKDLADWLENLRWDSTVDTNSIAVQNRIGQLLWNSETGITKIDIAPRFMNGTVRDSDECFYPGFWRDHTDKF